MGKPEATPGAQTLDPQLKEAVEALKPGPVAGQAARALGRWSDDAQADLVRLLGQARSAQQREVLLRSVAAGHPMAELRAFGAAIRPLSDKDLYHASGAGAEDPLWHYQQGGHPLSEAPAKDDASEPDPEASTWRGKPRR
ncbi:MAG TPA: hypothetical protein VEY30_09170 [Myxococcaceae bacterium]|nr:hypothetical protein [Myxococcaceae bacterium]